MSSVEDLYRWHKALLSYKLVKKETLDKAFTPARLKNGDYTKYGFGWFIDTSQGSKCIHHEGQINGFVAAEEYYPKEDTYVAILTNVFSGEDTSSFSVQRLRLFESIYLLALGKELVKEVIVSDFVLNRYTGKYEATFKPGQTLKIYKKDGKLYCDLSNGTGYHMVLVPQSETTFNLPDIRRIPTSCEFIRESGKPIKLVLTQESKYEWKKIK